MKRARSSGLRILLAEDHASTRLGVKQILSEDFRRALFGEAGDAHATLAMLEAQPWDVLILDISLPDCHGLDLLDEVKRRWPALPVLIYSAHPEDQFGVSARRARAAGYLTKERAPEELAKAVRTVLAGNPFFESSSIFRPGSGSIGKFPLLPHETLSAREFQVLRLSAAGLAGKAIAAELRLSQKTVSTYRTRLCRKLGLGSIAELVQYAMRHGLV